jgi:hypothetical protein
VLRGVGDAQAGLAGQGLDALLALGQVLQQVEPMGVAQATSDLGEGGEKVEFGGQARAPGQA